MLKVIKKNFLCQKLCLIVLFFVILDGTKSLAIMDRP